MKLPNMVYSDGIRKLKQIEFKGLDRTEGAQDGALRQMRNLYSDDYPVLSARPPRRHLGTLARPNGLFYHKGMLTVDGTKLRFEGREAGQVTDCKKAFGAIGPYIVILPDKVCYHTETGALEEMEQAWAMDDDTMMHRITSANAAYHDNDAYVNGNTCAAITVAMRKYTASAPAENTAPDFSGIFRVGDAVTIRGASKDRQQIPELTLIIRDFSRSIHQVAVGSYCCQSQIIFDEGALTGCSLGAGFTVTRGVPELKYLCEDGNRLWGCDGDTIYASKLGDPFSWNVFDGLETDSWALTPGSSGEFTGCINYQGYPTFFKEDRLYKVYGQTPSTFSVVDSPCLGVAAGCNETMAVVWGSLFYLGSNGPMVYTGSLPRPVDHALGKIRLTGGCAGSDGLKYYGSLSTPAGQRRLYVYDVQRGLWHIEDELEAVSFCRIDGDVYCLGADGVIRILGTPKTAPAGSTEEGIFSWSAEFADFTHGDPNHKGVSKLQLRAEIEEGAVMTVAIQFDSDGVWHTVRSISAVSGKRSFYLPIIPRRCDHYRLRLAGTGRAKVYSLVRESYSGSERSAR